MKLSRSSPAVLAVDEEDEEEFLCGPELLLLFGSGTVHWWLGKLRPPEARRRRLRSGLGGLQRAKELMELLKRQTCPRTCTHIILLPL